MDSFDPTNPPNMPKIDTASALNSRQKSCNACVRGKRRCDKRMPRCTRCAAKGLDCVYHKMPPFQNQQQQEHQHAQQSAHSGSTTGGSTTPEMADVPDFDMGFEMESLCTDTSPEAMYPQTTPESHQQHQHQHQHQQHQHQGGLSTGVNLAGLDFDIADFMNSTNPGNSLFNSMGMFVDNKLDIPPLPVAPLVPQQQPQQQQQQQQEQELQLNQPVRDLSLLRSKDGMCLSLDPLDVHDRRSWLAYTVAHITDLHKGFAKTRAGPFMHERLWATRLPKTILSVFSAATAYANRSGDNKAWVMKLLSDTATAVHRDGENVTSNLDKLARLQALLILDSIRVFDGDITLRAAAEREAPVFIKWFRELGEVRTQLEAEAAQFVGGAATHLRDLPPKNWEAWVILESTRRTQVICCAFMCMTEVLKSKEPVDDIWTDMSFTASKHLWDAPSSVEFFRAWREKPQYRIVNFDFKDFWMYARADDADEFTKLMLVPHVGLEAVEHFMAGETQIPAPSAV